MIYFLRADNGTIKIGHVKKDVWKRIRQLSTGFPGTLEPIGIMEGDVKGEKKIQRNFKHCCLTREWFQPADDLIAFIKKHAIPVEPPEPKSLGKPGRPSLSGQRKSERPLRIRLTDAERSVIDGAAAAAGKATSAWARELLLRAAGKVR